MKHQPIKKRVIIFWNFLLLLIPMVWANGARLEQFFGGLILQFFIIIGISILLFFGLKRGQYLSQKVTLVSGDYRNRLAFVLLFTILITGYKHFQYTSHVVSMVVYQDTRNSIQKKVKRAMWGGTAADDLTAEEYRYIKRYLCSSLLDIPKSADSISYSQSIDFPIGHAINFSYAVPLETEIDTFEYKGKESYYGQRFEIKNGLKYVYYSDENW